MNRTPGLYRRQDMILFQALNLQSPPKLQLARDGGESSCESNQLTPEVSWIGFEDAARFTQYYRCPVFPTAYQYLLKLRFYRLEYFFWRGRASSHPLVPVGKPNLAGEARVLVKYGCKNTRPMPLLHQKWTFLNKRFSTLLI